MAKVFKVWDKHRSIKKCFACEVDLSKIIAKGNAAGIIGSKVVLECDGTEIEDNETLHFFSNEILILMGDQDTWELAVYEKKFVNETCMQPSSSISCPSETVAINQEESLSTVTELNKIEFSMLESSENDFDLSETDIIKYEPDPPLIIFSQDQTKLQVSSQALQIALTQQDSQTKLKFNNRLKQKISPNLDSSNVGSIFKNYTIDWSDVPNNIKKILDDGLPIGNRLNDFVHYIIADMHKLSTNLTVPICRNVAKNIISLYPKSFGVLDHAGNIIDVEAISLTFTMVNHSNYIKRRDNIKLVNHQKVSPKNARKVKMLFNDVPNLCGKIEIIQESSVDEQESNRMWLKNNVAVQLNENESKKRLLVFQKTFNAQRKFLNNFDSPPTIDQIRFEWPILLKKNFIINHFNNLLGFDTSIFHTNFEKIVINIRDRNMITCKEFNQQNQNLFALKFIFKHFNENIDVIYCAFSAGTSTDNCCIKYNSPIIAAFEMDSDTNAYYIFIEQQRMPDSYQNLNEALHTLIAFYYAFNMKYPDEGQLSLTLLAHVANHSSFSRSKKKKIEHKANVFNFFKTLLT